MKRVFCHIRLFNSSCATTGSIIYYSLGSIYDKLSKTYTDEIQKFLSEPICICLPKVAKLARSLTVKFCPKWCRSVFTAVFKCSKLSEEDLPRTHPSQLCIVGVARSASVDIQPQLRPSNVHVSICQVVFLIKIYSVPQYFI